MIDNNIDNHQTNKIYVWRKRFFYVLLIFCICYPQHWQRLIYPYIYGKRTEQNLDSFYDEYFEDIEAESFEISRDKYSYTLTPTVKYHGTHRIGFVDIYDTFWNKIYRGQFQGKYIARTPVDLFLVNKELADPEIFKLFEFDHEERMGFIKCKGVKYQENWYPVSMSKEEYEENKRLKAKCDEYSDFWKKQNHDNYHPIPATESINKALHIARQNDVIYLEGYLVDVNGEKMPTRKGMSYQNKETLTGWCLTVYVTKVILNGFVYE